MESLFILIPIALVFVVIAVKAFFWSVKSGQFDDLDTEAKRILFDNEPKKNKKMQDHPQQQNQPEYKE
ncbi:cbb3-type cytochrome oxidase assembly protein CcoS [Teredinibacter sp. KSP-S5-2]|uniref:cbb3-type cytochrome oxidase assembly protein CcoS n=1 Tax=Teredinibacter sp. KSP-S5-2 TaxID=3034506 RepID=UPI00293527B1|nr:cbb3-type cytochrome oxidase assembly protein CcoS [Teredinibacter sp. KSP-S5-2]WNO10205.1 cbb3-type cytochrome oxidase assembly protein CcoS [Teredinibacter sp. KSP-S5-2]